MAQPEPGRWCTCTNSAGAERSLGLTWMASVMCACCTMWLVPASCGVDSKRRQAYPRLLTLHISLCRCCSPCPCDAGSQHNALSLAVSDICMVLQDLARTWRIAEDLQYGIVGVNEVAVTNEVSPFGGVKHSGLGREQGKFGIEEFLETKYVQMGIGS